MTTFASMYFGEGEFLVILLAVCFIILLAGIVVATDRWRN